MLADVSVPDLAFVYRSLIDAQLLLVIPVDNDETALLYFISFSFLFKEFRF